MTTALIIIGVILAALVLWFVAGYNSLIKLRNLAQEAWAQIDTELKRRHDLIGNLVETVKGYASHERETFDAVVRARSAAMAPGQSPADQAETEGELTQALGRLMLVVENYPELRANENFLGLQNELTGTEDRIASARRYYNATVRELNTKVETIPTNFIAGIANVTKSEYFEIEGSERDPVRVDFGQRQDIPPPGSYAGSDDAPSIEQPRPQGEIDPPRQ
ncbi:MAG: LemA family protein [Actinomycetia bacterium]|nr:LemA family protein [Actinomycetes bacterium]